MSQENVELARRTMQAFNDDALTDMAEFLDPEIAWHTDPLVPEAGVYEGRDQVLAYLQGYLRAFATLRFDVDEVIELPNDEVLVVTTFSGAPMSVAGETGFVNWCLVCRVRNGRFIRLRSFLDKGRAFQAAGLSE